MIQRNAQLETRLIDDLLDLTRATTGRLTLDMAWVDAHHVLEHAVEVCRAEIAESEIELDLDLRAGIHHLLGDAARLQQVFWNLIKNAAKFTPRGGKITIRTWNPLEDYARRNVTRFLAEVSDTGIGITADRLPKIFHAFGERDPQQHRRYGGLGLGLAISRSVLEAHGGRTVRLQRAANRGAAFTVELMAQACHCPGASPSESTATQLQ